MYTIILTSSLDTARVSSYEFTYAQDSAQRPVAVVVRRTLDIRGAMFFETQREAGKIANELIDITGDMYMVWEDDFNKVISGIIGCAKGI